MDLILILTHLAAFVGGLVGGIGLALWAADPSAPGDAMDKKRRDS